VDIHRKPGFDPCELFVTSRVRAGLRLLPKRIGLRYRMDDFHDWPRGILGQRAG
jgi:hypothetical protein